ncbi:citrate lyase subunit beta / citryl-CoA lyase [Arthrobacter sp. cf158]|uniref:HpcH/HpaI aldolase/citrate lyase family protein n=1 Tax=Arthrobacter sp. cf158 TaxID=1761744 RepID=UPI00089C6E5F|nr:CoA ester lyase [Arthrobacter sp. cf158]SDW90764.1 citrate lyase subunit beta / citryl-CoA lyase [Arthrobacter sp. cf158]
MTYARSVLSVPGSSQRFLDKAGSSAADVVMIDWEDGVGNDDKGTARELTNGFLHAQDPSAGPVWVRVNATYTEHFDHDAAAVNQWANRPSAVVLPMATLESAKTALARLDGVPLVAMIETAVSLEQAPHIASLDRIVGLMFGEYDFLATMAASGASRMSDTGWAKSRIINAAAAAGRWSIAGPNADFSDAAALQEQSRREASLGFAGKLCIHPNQIGTVNEEFGPAPEYVSWAKDLLEEIERGNHGGAFRFRGQMVDAPVIDRARAAVRLAGATR